VVITDSAAKPVRALGDFFAMSLDTFVQLFRPPWAWREFLLRAWFVVRVAMALDAFVSVRKPPCAPRGRDPYLVGAGVTVVALLGAFLFSVSVQDVTPGAKSRKRRSARARSASWAGHLRYVRQTRPQGGTLNPMSPVSKFLDV